jgi:hypothetical protein
MTLDKASKIVQIYGRYLEYCSKITAIFLPHIPESFLPFPKDTLFEALNIMTKHHQEAGNQRGVKLIQEIAGHLISYVDDEKALLQTAKYFNDPKWRQAFVLTLKNSQKDWIKTQGDF